MGRQFCQPPDRELQGSNCNVISILVSQAIDSSINHFDAPIAPILPLGLGEAALQHKRSFRPQRRDDVLNK